jgi:hypothetical protein
MNHITDAANTLPANTLNVPYAALDEMSVIVRGYTRNRDSLI